MGCGAKVKCTRVLRNRWLWVDFCLGPWVSFGFHFHFAPPHVHLDLHLPCAVIFIGRHGQDEV